MVPRLRIRKPESPSKYIQTEVRKVSTELGKVMEEAFNRSSISSSVETSVYDTRKDGSGYVTPPTSLSNRDSGGTVTLGSPLNKAAYQIRPLPPLPKETPSGFLNRKLAETREEIARQLLENNEESPEHIYEVLQELDNLMNKSQSNTAKRIHSAPAKGQETTGLLQVIPEENKNSGDWFGPYSPARRAFTDPVRTYVHTQQNIASHATIRMVDQSPEYITPAPLNIRKRSGVNNTMKNSESTAAPRLEPVSVQHDEPDSHDIRAKLDPLNAAEVPERKEATLKKKKSWFHRINGQKNAAKDTQPQDVQIQARLQIPEANQGPEDHHKNVSHKNVGPIPDPGKYNTAKQSDKSDSSEFPMRNCGTALGKSEGRGAFKGLLGFFGKKSKEEKMKRALNLEGM